MANDIKNEFEEYVQKLTTAICKEIFLEKLEEILKEYESGFQMMENSTGKVEFASNALLNEVKRAEKSMNYFEENIGKTTQLLTADIAKMESLMRNLFERMKSDNEESKRGFIEALAKSINDYKYEIEKTIHSGCDLISDKMQGIITPEQLTYFVEQIEENTRESKELATFINDTYKDEIVQNISTIINNNRIAVEQMEKELSLHINKIMASLEGAIDSTDIIFSKRAEDFSNVVKNQTAVLVKYLTKLVYGERDEREKFLTRQEELIKAIGPSDEKMNQLEAKVQRLEGLIREL